MKAEDESTEITMKVDNLRPDFYRDGTYSSTINITNLKTDGKDDRETLRSLSFSKKCFRNLDILRNLTNRYISFNKKNPNQEILYQLYLKSAIHNRFKTVKMSA